MLGTQLITEQVRLRALTKEELLSEAQRHHTELLRYALALCGDPDEAQDLLGELYLEIELGKLTFRERGATPKTFLCAVLQNKTRNVLRKFTRRARSYLADLFFREPHRPDEVFSSNQELVWLRKNLSTLPPRMQEVLRLRYLEGKSVKECQSLMGVSSPGTISEQERRGLERLRELAKQEGLR